MQEQNAYLDQSTDLLDLGIFLSVDLFDELMRSLATTYSRLWFYEHKKPAPDKQLLQICYQCYTEIKLLQDSSPIHDPEEKNSKIKRYSQELKRIRTLLEQHLR